MTQLGQRFEAVAEATEERGFCHPMSRHVATYVPRGKRLLVSFDNASSHGSDGPRYPWAYGLAEALGVSHLGIMMNGPNDWFRHAEVDDFFATLAEFRFFEPFSDVLLTGSSMGGYAACAFAAAVPGCRVLAFCPQARIDPAQPPYDTRYGAAFARGDWTGRYADAVAGARAARQVMLVYDPGFAPDRAQADMFDPANLRLLHVRWTRHFSPRALRNLGLLKQVTISALNDTLTEDKFAAIMRRRRDSAGWARTILGEALERGHWKLASRALDHLAEHQPDWRFPALKARIRRQRMAQARGRRAASLRAWAGSDAETGITGS